jgi:hypothetical protein
MRQSFDTHFSYRLPFFICKYEAITNPTKATKEFTGQQQQEISSAEFREDSVLIKDYSSNHNPHYNILQPFGRVQEIGSVALDQEGHRITIVNKDVSYVYVYIVQP